MKILITGSGGREHALAWRLSRDVGCENVYVAPGNAGTDQCAINVDLSANDFGSLADLIESLQIELVIVGPEEPLVNGFTDFLRHERGLANLAIVGPVAAGAMLEGSKDFAKQFMMSEGIPTAAYATFIPGQEQQAIAYIENQQGPYVMKADGLAAGKGVVILTSKDEAIAHIHQVFSEKIFGEAGNKLVIEEFLDGIEMSVFALTDGKNHVILPGAKDYKRIGDGNTGPNTGGMGTVSPVPFANDIFMEKVIRQIVEPTIQGLHKRKIDYRGFLFFGLMNVNGNPFVIEYNVRLGDPETQVLMPRIGGSFAELLYSAGNGNLSQIPVVTLPNTAVAVVLASKGYPGKYEKGESIHMDINDEDIVFHAGTIQKEGDLCTAGGRVMAAVGTGESLSEAIIKAYELTERIHFEGKTLRNDIGMDLMKYEAD